MGKSLPPSFWQTHLWLLITQVAFSLLPTLGKEAFRQFAPEVIAFMRISCTALLLAIIFFFFKRERLQSRSHVFHFALFALFGVVANQLLFLNGLKLTKAANASLLIATIPLFTLVLAALFRRERITLIKAAGVLVAFAGIALLLNVSEIRLGGYALGNAMIVTNALSYSIFLVISKPLLDRYHPLTVITWIFLLGSLEMLPFAWSPVVTMLRQPPPGAAFIIPAAIVVFCTFLPYLLNTMALRYSSSSLVAIYTYLQPLLGTILAVIWLGEKLDARFFLAATCIFTGIAMVSLARGYRAWKNV
ncbi:MAG: DMT family transporter [Candidatus Aminicenantes bacterium]|nr:DMT family transporter [Candidatus Aminicenantes bacterium]